MSVTQEHVAMTAPKAARLELVLGPKPGFPRQLRLAKCTDGRISAILYPAKSTKHMLAFTTAEIDRCRVVLKGDSCAWIGGASFDLTKSEADRIVETFEMRVER